MHPPFTADELHHLPNVLSAPRFATYLQEKANDRRAALDLYHWNLQVSAAFMVPLHVMEVSLRNGVSAGIEGVHGGMWPWTNGFIISLTNPSPPSYSPKKDLNRCAHAEPTTGKVIAELKLAFWEKMLTKRHHGRIWQHLFFTSFPDAPRGGGASQRRSELRSDVEEVRKLRNRIAHHEPVFSRNLHEDLERIMRCIEWRNSTSRNWVASIETVSSLLAIRP
ncbi:hypothetical protein [Phaeobacter porticola]|uniref:Abi-like protein n=1 Tax=Phaeobacter porticola TaxID=1844006 RepID=A0A1L3I6Z8_9RHOB|nr:hypothetical protein [Phaeobacter porticola]APG47802.1 Abi-like protein [Phaeobacter porticola]